MSLSILHNTLTSSLKELRANFHVQLQARKSPISGGMEVEFFRNSHSTIDWWNLPTPNRFHMEANPYCNYNILFLSIILSMIPSCGYLINIVILT